MKMIYIGEALVHCNNQAKLDFVRKMRTVEAEEVIHCIECKYHAGEYDGKAWRKCTMTKDYTPGHGYCHRAKRDGGAEA